MTGLEKILKKIEEDSIRECEGIRQRANKEAQDILRAAGDEGKARAQAVLENARNKCESEEMLAESAANAGKKRAVLAAKNRMIRKVMQNAIKTVKNLPEQEYFKLLGDIIVKNAQPGEGILYLSQRDRERVPEGFAEGISAGIAEGTLHLAEESRDIGGGAVIAYGDIEQNCTFEALLEESLEEVRDAVNTALFG